MRYLLIVALVFAPACVSTKEYKQLASAYRSYYDATKDDLVAKIQHDHAVGAISTVTAENRLSTVEAAGDALAAVESRVKGL